MAGKGTFSPHQTPQYGDKVALERMKTNTETPITGVPVERRGAGRPPEGGQPVSQQSMVPPEQREQMSEIAKAVKRLGFFKAVNAALDDSQTRMYLADAQREFERLSGRFEEETPDWDGV